ncbi:coiled-coil domain-containing protein 91-like [Saccostrea cucullata]|uniref:coiled-coil domain-containing protein 91-like n=1 Tax=Saccostrea cuccullata TaxID=36930 RepID=UPI002ED0D7D4
MDDEDDDFGDFGGFEAADPAFPVVDEIQPSVEAGPSPWAILDTASRSQVGMRPDLLCVQNQFPPVLDPTVPTQLSNGDVTNNQGPTTPPQELPPALDSPNNNAASLVNDILDGSFNRATEPNSQNSHPNQEASALQVPDIQETNGTETNNSETFQSHNSQSGTSDGAALPVQRQDAAAQPEHSSSSQPFKLNTSTTKDNNIRLGGGLNIAEIKVPQKPDTNNIVPPILSHDAQPVEQQLSLRQIQRESSDAVRSVVQEYKTLVQSSLQNHQESVNNLLQKNDKERQLQLELAIAQQNKDMEAAVQEMRQSLKEELERIAQESIHTFKEEMKETLEKEKKQIQEEMQSELQKEKDRINDLVQEAVSAERERGAQQLTEQKDQFLQLIEETKQQSLSQTQNLLEQERKQFQETLKKHMEEERKSHKESMDRVIEFANQEMRTYLQENRQMDRQLHQRQHASLDVFLSSAREQLKLLMENDTMLPNERESEEENSNPEEKGSSNDT